LFVVDKEVRFVVFVVTWNPGIASYSKS